MEIGYKLSSEEFPPNALVRQARQAEEAGFAYAGISDHYHPWTDRQGQSPFVWSVIGGIAATTSALPVMTAVTCPTMRIHPAIIAQASATAAAMMPGRFWFGVGTGEKLNEHILGQHWPPFDDRAEMLEEAIEIIRALWRGQTYSHRGHHYTVENARLYTVPEQPPPVIVGASGPEAASLAGRIGDGLCSTSPNKEVVEAFKRAGGEGKPVHGELSACWARDEATASRTAHEYWPIAGLKGALQSELPLPQHFEQAAQVVREEDVAAEVALGPDPRAYVEKIRAYAEAGFDHVWIHQIGPDQDGFFAFYRDELRPALERAGLLAPARNGVAAGAPGARA